jgi:hypothetical protein
MAALTSDAVEGSTYIVTVSFADETGATMIPVSATWSLRDNNQAIVNSRSNVSMTPATSVSIVLSGADLDYEANSSTLRILTVQAVYDGSYGSNLPLVDEYTFNIRPIVGV